MPWKFELLGGGWGVGFLNCLGKEKRRLSFSDQTVEGNCLVCVALQSEYWICIVDELRGGVLCSVGIEVNRNKTVACDCKETISNQ